MRVCVRSRPQAAFVQPQLPFSMPVESRPESLETTPLVTVGQALKRRIFFAVATGCGYRLLAIVVNFGMIYLLFRHLSEDLLGVWFLMVGAQTFTGLFDFGFGQTFQRRIAFVKANAGSHPDIADSEPSRQAIRDLLAIARRVYWVISATVGVGLYFGGLLYFASLDLSAETREAVTWAWAAMAIGYGANVWSWYVESTLNGLGDIGWNNLAQSVAMVLHLAATWLVLSGGYGLFALGLIWTLKGILVRLVGWWIVVARHRWIHQDRGRFVHGEFVSMLAPAAQWWLAIVGYFFMTGISRYLLASLSGADEVPDYVAAHTALVAVQGTMLSIVSVGTPLFSRLLKAGDLVRTRLALLRLMQISLLGLVLAYAFIAVFAEELFQLWLGPGHFVGYPVFAILALAMTVEAHQGMLQIAVVAAEELSWYKFSLLGGVLSLFLALWWIPQWNILGAALALLIPQLLTQSWIVPYAALRLLHLRFAVVLWSVILPALMAGVWLACCGLALKAVLPGLVSSILTLFVLAGTAALMLRKVLYGELAALWLIRRGANAEQGSPPDGGSACRTV